MSSVPAASELEVVPAADPRPTGGRLTVHRLLRSPSALLSASWLAFLVVVAVALPPFVETAANRQDLSLRLLPPFSLDEGFAFVLGADSLGRPELLQLVMGTRSSLLVAVTAVAAAAVVGMALGLVSGYFGGWVDEILMRIADVMHTIPSLLLALAVLYVLQPSVGNLVIVLAVTRVPVYLRTARAEALALRERVFVESSRAVGARDWRIIRTDLAPLVVPTIRTVAMLELASVLLAAAGLSFLGIGLQRPDVDWGMMVADGRAYLASAWWVTVLPGVAIVLTALAANLLSNWLRAAEDPAQAARFVRRPRGGRRAA
ncbi:ABC transporter permease [Phycicoccus sp. BSK3Z-2]|uniref:ABC transporter permease n=1 Tax=Phycicoccus avicenniae TaxID=2828860 RepID=A0A941I1Z1_9MICO|nr:ABC transporter permease [Phycicoccus avicenniae]MBR7744801.1 ABC transporter permease [Phycicoccus avicenniae]